MMQHVVHQRRLSRSHHDKWRCPFRFAPGQWLHIAHSRQVERRTCASIGLPNPSRVNCSLADGECPSRTVVPLGAHVEWVPSRSRAGTGPLSRGRLYRGRPDAVPRQFYSRILLGCKHPWRTPNHKLACSLLLCVRGNAHATRTPRTHTRTPNAHYTPTRSTYVLQIGRATNGNIFMQPNMHTVRTPLHARHTPMLHGNTHAHADALTLHPYTHAQYCTYVR